MAFTAEKVYNMLVKKNMTGTVRTLASKTYGSDGNVTEGTATETTVYMMPPQTMSSYTGTTLAEKNDTYTIISPYGLSILIKKGLKLTFDSQVWTINEVGSYYADNGIVVAYELGLIK